MSNLEKEAERLKVKKFMHNIQTLRKGYAIHRYFLDGSDNFIYGTPGEIHIHSGKDLEGVFRGEVIQDRRLLLI